MLLITKISEPLLNNANKCEKYHLESKPRLIITITINTYAKNTRI